MCICCNDNISINVIAAYTLYDTDNIYCITHACNFHTSLFTKSKSRKGKDIATLGMFACLHSKKTAEADLDHLVIDVLHFGAETGLVDLEFALCDTTMEQSSLRA